ncbi:MAG TPA: hypothetical protein VLT92_18900, partial [Burkholderiales bacterium]|nr:hypothetical protein [Burkholderiales bacterium]
TLISCRDIQAVTGAGADPGAVRRLFVEYARSPGFSLCFQGFDREPEKLPGGHAPALYRNPGFRRCAPYCDSAAIGSACLELALAG